jgi:glycosyltransferase involved in cell wall biosynthesis
VEVVGTAGTLVPPDSADALAQSITALLRDENRRQHLSSAAIRRAGMFSWNNTACLMLEVYREACERDAHEKK